MAGALASGLVEQKKQLKREIEKDIHDLEQELSYCGELFINILDIKVEI